MQNMQKIIAREQELKVLEKIFRSNQAEFLAVYGRRRVGKTYLISEFFKDKGTYFELTGSKGASTATQLKSFTEEFVDCFGVEPSTSSSTSSSPPKTWQQALTVLRRQVEKLDPNQKVIIFFDELPWLASPKSGFLSALEHTWNRYLSRCSNVILIVCGSATSWMIKKIIYNKGGLYGRLTCEMQLQPYTLAETEIYLKSRKILLDRKQIIDLYLAFGGVAKYLSHIPRGKSSVQIIQKLFFQKRSPLATEFRKLYASLFDHPDHYIAIVQALAKSRGGMTQKEILKVTGLVSGGRFSKLLRELEESGFILFFPNYGHKKREGKYRLIDEYSLFYLTWVSPAIELRLKNVGGDYWQRVQGSPAYLAWAGYSFEGICLKHIDRIIDALKLSVVTTSVGTWTYSPPKGTDARGAQIDLVIDRADRCCNLCEIKYVAAPFTITKEYGERLRYKKECFRSVTQTKHSLFTTMITTYGTEENTHYFSSVDNQLTMDVLFADKNGV